MCGECGWPMVPTIGDPSDLVCLARCDGIAAMLEAAASVPSSKGRIGKGADAGSPAAGPPRGHVPRFVMGPETLNRAPLPPAAAPQLVCRHCRGLVRIVLLCEPAGLGFACDPCGWQIGFGMPEETVKPAPLIVPGGSVLRPNELSEALEALRRSGGRGS